MKITKRSVVMSLLIALVAVGISSLSWAADAIKSPTGAGSDKQSSPHIVGQITAIDTNHIEVKPQKGETLSIKLTSSTVYGGKKQSKQLSDFHVGDKVAVAYQKADDGTLTAAQVSTPRARKNHGGATGSETK